MTNDPRTFEWEYDEPRKSVEPVGPDGFLLVSDQNPPQVTIEATLRFEGTELKGYTGVFEVPEQFAPREVFLGICVPAPEVPTNPALVERIVIDSIDFVPGDDVFLGGFLDTAVHSDFEFTTSFEFIIKWAPNDWSHTPQAFCSSEFKAGDTGYRWGMGPTATPNFYWWSGGTLFDSTVPTYVPIVANGVPFYQRLTFDVSGGSTTINHYDRRATTDPWRLLFNDVRGTEEPIDPLTYDSMRVGGETTPIEGFIDGDLYFIQFYDAEGGTLLAEMQASSFTTGDGQNATAADFSGKAWKINGVLTMVA